MARHASEPAELLRKLGNDYRHFEQEHSREPLRSPTRHRIAKELRGIEDHFERLLAEWVQDDDMRAQWRAFLHGRDVAPDGPRIGPAPLFKGRTEAGALLELRPGVRGYDLLLDGARIDHSTVPWHLDPDMYGAVQIGDHACEETFDAPPEAIRALADFLVGRAGPPWRWARELIEDGLIDPELALTPRGQRCLQRAHPVRQPPARARNYCVLVADGARARVLVLDQTPGTIGTALSELIEVAEITNPMLRARDVEVLSDSRPGLRRESASTPRHAVSDRREGRRRDIERHFAARVAEEGAAVWRRYPACDLIVVASPVMLGLLRPAIERLIRPKDHIAVHELARDLTKMRPPMLHDLLADIDLLPSRGRLAPLLPVRGLPT